MSSIQIQSGKQASLVFFKEESGEEHAFSVEENASTIVGRDQSCGIVLEDERVSGRHCMFRVADGKLFVSDWHSEHGTIVNDQPITQEVELQSGDQVSLGGYDVRWSIEGVGNESEARPVESAPLSEEATDRTLVQNHEPYSDPSTSTSEESTPSSSIFSDSEPQSQNTDSPSSLNGSRMNELERENRELKAELEQLLDKEFNQDSMAFQAPVGLDQQEVQLLRDEVAQLQSELAEREQQLNELLDSDLAEPDSQDDISANDTEQLVNRLEQLLDELQNSDRRVASMEDLLRAADEAQQAETEERQQIENWLGEIEERVGQREQEWKSQTEQLSQRIEELSEDRSRIQSQWSAAMKSSGNQIAKQAEEELQSLREQNETLSNSLDQTREELRSTSTRLEAFEAEQGEDETALDLRKRLKQQELEMVQERAALSRQKAELARMRDEVEQAASCSTKDVKSSDLRLKALRDHLREIHDEEKEEKQSQGGGLASRLSRLWNRLDSR